MRNQIASKQKTYKQICTETPEQRVKRVIQEKEEEEEEQQ
jgi:hypothetical protein